MKNLVTIIFLLASLNILAQSTYVPDDNFEQSLIDFGYDTVLDDFVLTANINSITSLNVSNKSISDLTGIEDFTSLTYLNCSSNQLTSLDVSADTALTYLNCENNQLTSLDVSANTDLTTLDCSENQLTSLDVSADTSLTYLNCSSNQLTSLDVSANTDLTHFYCQINQLTSLDISNNTALTKLYCNNNQLTSLDVSANTDLTYLWCFSNQLTSLDVRNGNNTNFMSFDATNNPNLKCIFVDDAAWCAANWTNIDDNSTFVETEAECDALDVHDILTNNDFVIYPNPAKDIFRIDTDSKITSIRVYDIFGKLIKTFNKQADYPVSDIAKGVYLIHVKTEKGIQIIKLIRE